MSFGWSIMFRKGAWEEFRRFSLLQRQNVPSRVRVLDKEISKIGQIRIRFERAVTEDGESRMTERRAGLDIKEGTALCKLLQAYIARGGNPFDISMFLSPDSYNVSDEGKYTEDQPYGGVVYPTSAEAEFSGVDTRGWLNLWRYIPRKTGDKKSPWSDYGIEIGSKTESAKGWISQEIKELRNDLEARIIKLCDLREQLMKERFDLIQEAVGGTVPLFKLDTANYSEEHHLFSVINFMDSVFYNTDSSQRPNRQSPREDVRGRPYPTLLGDADTGEEDFTAIG